MKKPVIRQIKKVPIRNQSVLLRLGLLSRDTSTYMSRGPQAHHSPQIEAGDATLIQETHSGYRNSKYCGNNESSYPSISMQSPPQFKKIAKTVAKVPIETILNATK